LEAGEDDLEVVDGIGVLGVGDGATVGSGVELLGDAAELDAFGQESVLRVAAEGVPPDGDLVAQVVEGVADGGFVNDVAIKPVSSPGVQIKDVGAVGAEVPGEATGVEDILLLGLTWGLEPGGQGQQGQVF